MDFCLFLFLIKNWFSELLLLRRFLFPTNFLFPSFVAFKMSSWEWFLLTPNLLFELNILSVFDSSFLFSLSFILTFVLFLFSFLNNFSSFLFFAFFFLSIGVCFLFWTIFSFVFFFIFKFIFIGSDFISEKFSSSFVWLKLVLVIALFFVNCSTSLSFTAYLFFIKLFL